MLDRILLDLDPYFLSWVSWLNVTLFVILFVVSLWGIIKGRSVCYLIALAAIFMFIDRTLVVNTIDVLKKREFASEAKNLGVCSKFKDVNYKDVKKKEMKLSDDMSAEEIKALGFDYENDDMFFGGIKPLNLDYENCVEQWVNENDIRVLWLNYLIFIFRLFSELLRVAAFLSVLAMLNDRGITNIKGVVRWYFGKAECNG